MTFFARDSLLCVKMILRAAKKACSGLVAQRVARLILTPSPESFSCFQLGIAAPFQCRTVKRHVCFAQNRLHAKSWKLPG